MEITEQTEEGKKRSTIGFYPGLPLLLHFLFCYFRLFRFLFVAFLHHNFHRFFSGFGLFSWISDSTGGNSTSIGATGLRYVNWLG